VEGGLASMGYAFVDKNSGLGLVWVATLQPPASQEPHVDEQGQVMVSWDCPCGLQQQPHVWCWAGPCLVGLMVGLMMSRAPCYSSACDRCSAYDVGSSAAAFSVLAGGDM
jgi:hypothetical protein